MYSNMQLKIAYYFQFYEKCPILLNVKKSRSYIIFKVEKICTEHSLFVSIPWLKDHLATAITLNITALII